MTTGATAEVVEDAVAVLLCHLRMNEVAGVAKFNNLLSKKLHASVRITEYDGLIDLKLGSQLLRNNRKPWKKECSCSGSSDALQHMHKTE